VREGRDAGDGERDLSLADVDLSVGRAWLADFDARGRKPATVAARARSLRSAWTAPWLIGADRRPVP
jgi:hypothetical protein